VEPTEYKVISILEPVIETVDLTRDTAARIDLPVSENEIQIVDPLVPVRRETGRNLGISAQFKYASLFLEE
jgi:hypothetical protein